MWCQSRFSKFISVLLVAILSLTFIVAPKREAEAAFPLALAPGIYHVIASGLILAGAYAVTTDGFQAIVQDFYEDLEDNVKSAFRAAGQDPENPYYTTAEMAAALAAYVTSLFLGQKTQLDWQADQGQKTVVGIPPGQTVNVQLYSGALRAGYSEFTASITQVGEDATYWYNEMSQLIWVGDTINGYRYQIYGYFRVTKSTMATVSSFTIYGQNYANNVAGTNVTLLSLSSPSLTAIQSFYNTTQTSNGTTTTTSFGNGYFVHTPATPQDADKKLGNNMGVYSYFYPTKSTVGQIVALPFLQHVTPVAGNVGWNEDAMNDPQFDPVGKKIQAPAGWVQADYLGKDAYDMPVGTISEPGEGIWDEAWDSIISVLESIYTAVLSIPSTIVTAVNNTTAAVNNSIAAIQALPASIATAISNVFVPSVPLSTYWTQIYDALWQKFPFSFVIIVSDAFTGSPSSGYPSFGFTLAPSVVWTLNFADFSSIFSWSRIFMSVLFTAGGFLAVLKMLGVKISSEPEQLSLF